MHDGFRHFVNLENSQCLKITKMSHFHLKVENETLRVIFKQCKKLFFMGKLHTMYYLFESLCFLDCFSKSLGTVPLLQFKTVGQQSTDKIFRKTFFIVITDKSRHRTMKSASTEHTSQGGN